MVFRLSQYAVQIGIPHAYHTNAVGKEWNEKKEKKENRQHLAATLNRSLIERSPVSNRKKSLSKQAKQKRKKSLPSTQESTSLQNSCLGYFLRIFDVK